MSETQNVWYPKCIILYGCEIPDHKVYELIQLEYPSFNYIIDNILLDNFYDDVSSGAFTKDNQYELRRYKTNMHPPEETFYFVLNKIAIDISIIGNVKVELKEPDVESIQKFQGILNKIGLKYNKYVIITG